LADTAGGLKVVNEKAVIQQQTGEKLTGQSVGGRYLPSQKVQKEKVGKTKIYVQAGAFAQLDNANKMRDKLHTLGTQILPVTVGGKQLYRVRVGPLPNVPSADAELQRVINAGGTEAKIVVE
jgi:rare lipoprotein A